MYPKRWVRELAWRSCIVTAIALVTTSCSRTSAHQQLLEEQTLVVRQVTKILAEIRTVADARAHTTELRRLQDQGYEIQGRMQAVIGQPIHWAAKDGARRALADNKVAQQAMLKEAMRLQQDPEIWLVLGEILMPR